jgi:hypothetical protein
LLEISPSSTHITSKAQNRSDNIRAGIAAYIRCGVVLTLRLMVAASTASRKTADNIMSLMVERLRAYQKFPIIFKHLKHTSPQQASRKRIVC